MPLKDATPRLDNNQAFNMIALELSIANKLKQIEILQRADHRGGTIDVDAAQALIDDHIAEVVRSYYEEE